MKIKNIVLNIAAGVAVIWMMAASDPHASAAPIAAQDSYPGAGKTIEVNFGVTIFRLTFADDHHMSFLGVSGESKDVHDSGEYTARKIRPGLYMVYWHEPHTGHNVVHLQDFERGIVHTNIAQPDGQFLHRDGTLKLLKERC